MWLAYNRSVEPLCLQGSRVDRDRARERLALNTGNGSVRSSFLVEVTLRVHQQTAKKIAGYSALRDRRPQDPATKGAFSSQACGAKLPRLGWPGGIASAGEAA
jgi:hypothetical protein